MPFPKGAQADAALTTLLQYSDSRPEWQQVKPPGTVLTVIGHRRDFLREETELINAYGIDGCQVTCLLASFGGDQPEKFDRLVIDGVPWVIQAAIPQEGFQGAQTIVRCYCRGS